MHFFRQSPRSGLNPLLSPAVLRALGKIRNILLVFLLGSGTADAFPPAPYYTLYGVVCDQVGQTVTAEGAEVILLKGGVEVGRTAITSSRIDQNYELNMQLDQNRSGTTFYTDKAVVAGGSFSLVVCIGGTFAAGATAHQTSDAGIVSALTAPRSDPSEFYRHSVR